MKPVTSMSHRLAHAFALLSMLAASVAIADRASAEDPPGATGTTTGAAAPPPAPTAPPATPGGAGPLPIQSTADDDSAAESQQAFNRELLTVEEDVGRLKERVFRSKSTLEMLKELIIEGAAAGAHLSIWHVNQIGGAYSIEAAQYWLDGKTVFTKTEADGGLDDLGEIQVFQGNVNPGTHTIQVSLALRGKGFKVFSYLRSYQFRLQSSYELQIDEGKTKTVRCNATTRSGLRSFTDRPTIVYAEQSGLEGEEHAAGETPPAGAEAAPADDGKKKKGGKSDDGGGQ